MAEFWALKKTYIYIYRKSKPETTPARSDTYGGLESILDRGAATKVRFGQILSGSQKTYTVPKIWESAVNTRVSAVNKRDFIMGILGTVYVFWFRRFELVKSASGKLSELRTAHGSLKYLLNLETDAMGKLSIPSPSPAFRAMPTRSWSASSLAAGEAFVLDQLEKQMKESNLSIEDKIAASWNLEYPACIAFAVAVEKGP